MTYILIALVLTRILLIVLEFLAIDLVFSLGFDFFLIVDLFGLLGLALLGFGSCFAMIVSLCDLVSHRLKVCN